MRQALFSGLAGLAAACASAPRAPIDLPPLVEIRAESADHGASSTATAGETPVAPGFLRASASLALWSADPMVAPLADAMPAAAAPSPPRDEGRADSSYTALTLGTFEPAGDLSRANTGFWGDIAFGRRFARLFVVEAAIGYYDASGSFVDVYGVPLTLEGRVGFPILILEPYVGVGGGGVWVHSSVSGLGSEDDFAPLLDAFVGLEVGIDAFGVGAEYKYVYSGDVDVAGGGTANLEGSVFTLMGRVHF